jgi:hypothetical protein
VGSNPIPSTNNPSRTDTIWVWLIRRDTRHGAQRLTKTLGREEIEKTLPNFSAALPQRYTERVVRRLRSSASTSNPLQTSATVPGSGVERVAEFENVQFTIS